MIFVHQARMKVDLGFISKAYRPLSHNAETKDFARPTSHPVRGWTGKNKAFCSPGTQNGRRVIKVYLKLFLNMVPSSPTDIETTELTCFVADENAC